MPIYVPPPPPASGSTYVDPNTGRLKGMNQDTTFNQTVYNKDGSVASPGRAALGYALGDSGSDLSNSYYYGGDRGAAGREFSRQSDMRYNFAGRGPVQADFRNADQAAGIQDQYASGLARAVAGDPNSLGQKQLAAGYNQANAAATSNAMSARGDAGSRALAARTARNQRGENVGAQQIASDQLMVNEQNTAMGQLSGLANTMRSQGQEQAFGQANLAMGSRQQNVAAELGAVKRGMNAARMGLQGEMNRQGARRDVMATTIGLNNAQDEARRQQGEHNMKMAMGAAGAGATAGGTILQGLGGAQPQPGFFQQHPEYGWDR